MRSILKQDDLTVNPKRIIRLMNLRAIYPLKPLTKPGNGFDTLGFLAYLG